MPSDIFEYVCELSLTSEAISIQNLFFYRHDINYLGSLSRILASQFKKRNVGMSLTKMRFFSELYVR